MPEQVIEVLKFITRGLEITGAGLLALGFVVATVRCIRQLIQHHTSSVVKKYRQALGRTALIGLEVLVAATILKTITAGETVESLSFLVIMVIIRTTLSWTIVLEMIGRWPWQRPRNDVETASDVTA